jgi:malate synthase
MSDRISIASLDVAKVLYDFISNEGLRGTGLTPEHFWGGVAAIVRDFGPRNRELLATRDLFQAKINDFHRRNEGNPLPVREYVQFLYDIGYLVPEVDAFAIATGNIDREIAEIAGPQLVVPLSNARYALNAANARWGSLYDALYGTDAIADDGGATRGSSFNKIRAERVITRARELLDEFVPLENGSHKDVVRYSVSHGQLTASLKGGSLTTLKQTEAFVGFRGSAESPTSILLRHHNLHLELRIDPSHPIGREDSAHIADVIIESAITTIMDLEDSVAVQLEAEILLRSLSVVSSPQGPDCMAGHAAQSRLGSRAGGRAGSASRGAIGRWQDESRRGAPGRRAPLAGRPLCRGLRPCRRARW